MTMTKANWPKVRLEIENAMAYVPATARREAVRGHLALLRIGLRGMARHDYLGEDWIAHNALQAQAFDRVRRMIGDGKARDCRRVLIQAIERDSGQPFRWNPDVTVYDPDAL
jgi:hypothetical protein